MASGNKIHFTLLSPSAIICEKDVDFAILPQEDGDLTIMHGHYPIISLLRKGKIVISLDKKEEIFTVGSGIAKTDGKQVTVTSRDIVE